MFKSQAAVTQIEKGALLLLVTYLATVTLDSNKQLRYTVTVDCDSSQKGNMMKHKKVCQFCGETFGTNWPGAKFCSHAHRQAAYRQRHELEDKSAFCIWCGKRFWPERGGAKFCGSAHKQAAYRVRAKRGGQLMLGE